MKPVVSAILLLVVLFAIPIVPFVILGETFEQSLLEALKNPAPDVVALWTVGLLAVDIFLPVPSSAVITYAGGILGIWLGGLLSWIGLCMGAIAGFWLARLFGYALVARFSGPADIARLHTFARRHGILALVATRALPILAEACVLLLGATRQPWRQFLPALVISNALLAVTYAACGQYFHDRALFPLAIVASGALPLIAALIIRHWWKP